MALCGAMLFVKDVERMTAFYADVLGLKVMAKTRLDNWVEFESAGARFSLHAIPPEIASGMTIASPPVRRERSATKLTFARCRRRRYVGANRGDGPPALAAAVGRDRGNGSRG
jgi:catechol 2,3-dioxygenase-like lactoylglutathione lyase family enzyme